MSPTRPRLLALAALAAVAGLVALAVVRGSSSTYEVTATFDQVRGLIEGGEVKAGAQNVGVVEEITLDEHGTPVVTMAIDSDYRIRQGAFADIRLVSNIGAINRYVELSQGDGPELSDGAVLGPSRTDQPVDLDLAVSIFDPETRREMGELIAAVDRSTRGRGADLSATLRHGSAALGETANVLAQVNADGLALRTLVSEGRRLVGALARDPESLGATAELLAQTLDVAAARRRELARTAATFGPALASSRRLVERVAASTGSLRGLVADSGPAVDQLAPTIRVLRPAVSALRPLLAEVDAMLSEAPRQLRSLNRLLAEVNPVLRRLEPVLEGMGPLLDHLRARAPEIVGFFTLFADATSSFDVNGNLIRATAIPIQSERHPNLIEGSSDAAGSLVRPFDRVPGAAEGEPWEDYARSLIGGGRPPEDFIEPDEESP